MTSTVPALGTRTAEGSALQAVLLDMDGTLVDTEGFWWDVEVEIFAGLAHALDDSWRHVVVGGPMTRSAGFLIEATGADITFAELFGPAQRRVRGPYRPRPAPHAGRRPPPRRAPPRTRSRRPSSPPRTAASSTAS